MLVYTRITHSRQCCNLYLTNGIKVRKGFTVTRAQAKVILTDRVQFVKAFCHSEYCERERSVVKVQNNIRGGGTLHSGLGPDNGRVPFPSIITI